MASIVQQLIEPGATRPGTADLIGVLVDDLESTLGRELMEIVDLVLGVLIDGR